MSDLRIPAAGVTPQQRPAEAGGAGDKGGFETAMKEAIDKVGGIQGEVENAINALVSGGDVTQAVIAMEKADMSFQMMVEVRNRLLNAYEEIMRMQV